MWYYLVAPDKTEGMHTLNSGIDQTCPRNSGNLEQVAWSN